jgi:hypothetical protein
METLAVVSMSGGKDSTATALLAIETFGPAHVRLVMADTGNEHDLTMEYALDYLPAALGIPVHVVRADLTKRIENKRIYVQEKWPGKGVPQHVIDTALAILHPTGNPFLDLCLWKGRVPSRKAQFCTQELKRYPLDAYTSQPTCQAEGHIWNSQDVCMFCGTPMSNDLIVGLRSSIDMLNR